MSIKERRHRKHKPTVEWGWTDCSSFFSGANWMKLQVCWQQMGCLQLAMSGKEQRFIYLPSYIFLWVWFGPCFTVLYFTIFSPGPQTSREAEHWFVSATSHIQMMINQEVTHLGFWMHSCRQKVASLLDPLHNCPWPAPSINGWFTSCLTEHFFTAFLYFIFQITTKGEATLCYRRDADPSSYFTTPIFSCAVWFAAFNWGASVFSPFSLTTVKFAATLPLLSCLFSCLAVDSVLLVLRWWTGVVVFTWMGILPGGRRGSSPMLTVRLV